MGKNKKKSKPTMSKPELSKRLLALMSNHPGESYNYKQLAMRLQVKSMDMKRQISEVLRELGEKGELESPMRLALRITREVCTPHPIM